MSEVKRYHVTEAGLVEGQVLGRINVVLGADHDRVTAERDALQQRLTAADERVDLLEGLLRQFSEVAHGGFIDDDHVRRVRRDVDAALNPANGGGDDHICAGCGSKGWTANCKECVPY